MEEEGHDQKAYEIEGGTSVKARHIVGDEKLFGMGLELDIQRFKIMAETEVNKRGKESGEHLRRAP